MPLFVPKLHVQLFGQRIHSFHFFGVLGFMVGALLGVIICQATNLQPAIILYMTLTGALTFFVLAFGAKIVTGREYIVYYHHEIAILLMGSAVLKIAGWTVLPYIDVTILGIATFLAFGRIGCFSVGCCHGQPGKKGIVYSHAHVKSGFTWYYEGIPLLPVQLIESAFVFIFIITGVYLLCYQHLPPGTILILYTVVYGSFRFMVEFFRGDPERPYIRGLSEAQWTTLLLVTVSLLLSYAGLLPLYNWHLMIFIGLLLWSGFAVLRNKKNSITLPAHIGEIAKALHALENNSLTIAGRQKLTLPVQVMQTNMGLSLSKGEIMQNGKIVKHYTISCKNSQILTAAIAKKLAAIIRGIDKIEGSFTLHEKNNGIFQILFDA